MPKIVTNPRTYNFAAGNGLPVVTGAGVEVTLAQKNAIMNKYNQIASQVAFNIVEFFGTLPPIVGDSVTRYDFDQLMLAVNNELATGIPAEATARQNADNAHSVATDPHGTKAYTDTQVAALLALLPTFPISSPTIARNVLLNPAAQINSTGVTVSAGGTLSRITGLTIPSYAEVTTAHRMTYTDGSVSQSLFIGRGAGLTGAIGDAFVGGVLVRASAAGTYQVRVVNVGTAVGVTVNVVLAANVWTWVPTPGGVLAAAGTQMGMAVGNQTVVANGTTLDAVAVLDRSTVQPGAYFDGNIPGARWTGTAGSTGSELRLPRAADLAAAARAAAPDVCIPRSLLTAKGDLIVSKGVLPTDVDRLPVGNNGAALVADSGVTLGVKWSTVRYLEGAGTPEGSVSAPVGSRYVDTAVTNGASEWIKVSGTGNTGWRVVYGDTGWRAIAASHLVNGWTATAMQIRRINNMVELFYQGLNGSAATSDTLVTTTPAGFSPTGATPRYRAGLTTAAGLPDASHALNISGTIICRGTRSTLSAWGGDMWTAPDAWPTALPGTAA